MHMMWTPANSVSERSLKQILQGGKPLRLKEILASNTGSTNQSNCVEPLTALLYACRILPLLALTSISNQSGSWTPDFTLSGVIALRQLEHGT